MPEPSLSDIDKRLYIIERLFDAFDKKLDKAMEPAAILEGRVDRLEGWTGIDEGSGRPSLARWRDNMEGLVVGIRTLGMVLSVIVAALTVIGGFVLVTGAKP